MASVFGFETQFGGGYKLCVGEVRRRAVHGFGTRKSDLPILDVGGVKQEQPA